MVPKYGKRAVTDTVMKNMDTDEKFIDIHTHILPGLDDGSPDTETSFQMLSRLKAQNVGTVVLTPHFYTDRETMLDFLDRRDAALRALEPIARQLDVGLVNGCEMYFSDYVFNNEDLSPVCINSGKYLLTELPFSCRFSDSSINKIARLIADFSVIPVLAHIERYAPLMKDRKCLEYLLGMGCLAQINLDALRDGFLQRKTLLGYIEDNLVHVVGTDCHNMSSRAPYYTDGIRVIEKKSGAETVKVLQANALQIIRNQ